MLFKEYCSELSIANIVHIDNLLTAKSLKYMEN